MSRLTSSTNRRRQDSIWKKSNEPHMSSFGGKADMTRNQIPISAFSGEPIMGADHVDFYLGRNDCAGYRVLGDGRGHAV